MVWCGVVWCGVVCGVVCCVCVVVLCCVVLCGGGGVWCVCGVVWCGVVWCGVVWCVCVVCGVVWCGVVVLGGWCWGRGGGRGVGLGWVGLGRTHLEHTGVCPAMCATAPNSGVEVADTSTPQKKSAS